MRRTFPIVCVIVVGVLLIGAVWRSIARGADAAALKEQLRLAHSEGIPTTWKEFAAGIKPALPAENAAPLYHRVYQFHGTQDVLSKIDPKLNLGLTPESEKTAADLLRKSQTFLALNDQAARLPHCWFNRDWSQGMAVLMPEFASMKYAAKLILLRGSLAAAKNHPDEALSNFREAIQIANHVGEEGTAISTLVKLAIDQIAIHHLALWSFKHRSVAAYVKQMSLAVASWPTIDLQWMHRIDLLATLDLVELCSTPEGRKKLGLKPDDVDATEPYVGIILSRSKAKVQIAKIEREIWEAYGKPANQRDGKIGSERRDLALAFHAFPTASQISGMLSGGDDAASDHIDQIFQAKKLEYMALLRALGGTSIPKKIKTADLLSPFDSKPVQYEFDGNQIVVTVSCPNPDIDVPALKLPSDAELTALISK